MFVSVFSITTALCSLRLSITAAAVSVASDGFIIPVGLQQSSNDTHSSNITTPNGLQSSNAIKTGNSTYAMLPSYEDHLLIPEKNRDAANDFYRYPVPGTKYVLFVSDCSTDLDPAALKATFLQGIAYIDNEIVQGRGAETPESIRSYIKPILVEWRTSLVSTYHCPYNDLLHVWKALRLVLLDKTTRFPSWLYSRECAYRVTWDGIPGDPMSAGVFFIKATEPEGALAGDTLGGALNTSVGTV